MIIWLGINSGPQEPNICCPMKKRNGCIFYVPARFHISPSLHSSLPSLIANYNPSHKLLTQWQALTNCSKRPIKWVFFYYCILFQNINWKICNNCSSSFTCLICLKTNCFDSYMLWYIVRLTQVTWFQMRAAVLMRYAKWFKTYWHKNYVNLFKVG